MIHDVDESLKALIRRDALAGSEVELALDAPTKEWAARRNAPALDLYLYDIREAMSQRQMGEQVLRDDVGHITARRPFPRRFRLSYLITAWTQRPEDEHRLLSSTLGCFLSHDAVPDDLLVGSLADHLGAVQLSIAVPPPQDRAISDIWSALGGELKPSLDLVVTAPFDLDRAVPAAALVTEEPRLRFRLAGGDLEEPTGIAGGTPEPAEEAPYIEETITGGTADRPGRTVTIRAMPS